MQAAVRVVIEQRYGDLIRLAYLVLDDGTARPGALLATARHLVRSAAARSSATADPDETYTELRRRLAGRLVADPPAIFRFMFRQQPEAPPDGRTRATLRKLSRHARLAYVLARVEGLSAYDIDAELDRYLAITPDDVTRTLAEVDAATGLSADEQRTELCDFDPTVVRLRPLPSVRGRGRVLVAGALALLVAGSTIGYVTWRQTPHRNDLALVSADRWRQERSPDVTVWPTQGARKRDLDLLRRARDSWRRNPRTPPVGRIYVMYAGDVGDATTVIMHDTPAARGAPLIAQYVERPLSRGVESVRELGIGSHDMILIDALTNRYLVPPWRRDLRVAPLDRPQPEWQRLAVHDGVTDPLPWEWFDVDCQFYVVFQATDEVTSPNRVVTTLASHVSASATPAVSFRVPGPTRYDETALDSQVRWDAVRTLACDGAVYLQDSADLRVGELWRGELPDGGGEGRILTIERAGGTAEQNDAALLVTENGRTRSDGDSNSEHVLGADELAAAVWWRSRRSQRWYLVVAAAPRVPRFYVLGELGRHEPDGRSLILQGPKSGPDIDKRPVVQVVVYEPDGDRSVITP